MSVPPELMKLLGGGGAPGGMPGAGGPKPVAPPGAAGMATPQKKSGEEAAAKTNLQIAMNMCEQALPVFGSETKQGKAILKALNILGDVFGNDGEQELVPAQIMQLMKSEPSMGGGMMQKAMQGGPGGAPGGAAGGAPPGMPPQQPGG